ncbi:hypothetical protein [Aquabacter sediminis]|uniref:hypothetical protein n=1 Tax=Aquabacter sediminis TaxID=3029197 RepID=UPI00237D56AE|nr:hypothetical protein [Aquabacter sp. P-9]MDE1569661.1 hypothetical protein [Aquabacter sp. P-9]
MKAALAAFALILGVAGARAEPPASLSCEGVFARDTDKGRLVAAFGAPHVRDGEIPGAEGSTERGTLVFADDPARRIEILWQDEKKSRIPAMVRVGPESTWTFAVPGGTLKPGQTLAEVRALNGGPFALSGFEWDYGGTVTDWKTGRLARIPGGCTLSLIFAPDPDAPEKARLKVSGDATFSSDGAAMKAVRPKVEVLSFGWPATP